MPQIPLLSAGYTGRSVDFDASRMVNLFPELAKDGKSIGALVGTPGLNFFTSLGGPVRGVHVFNGILYAVSGSALCSINAAGVVTPNLAVLNTNSGRVGMADNGIAPFGGSQLAITDGTAIYIWNIQSSSWSTVAIAANTICFLNGYFLADITVAGQQKSFSTSAPYDGTTWNAADYTSADAYPDSCLAVFNNHMEAWIFGEYSTEIWYVTGQASPNRLARISGGVIEAGLAARWSVAKADSTVFWLATQKNNDAGELVGIVKAEGYSARIISPASINYQISRFSTVSDAFAYTYSEDGHTFYVITFPTGNATFVYDTSTDMWHERSSYTGEASTFGRHKANAYALLNNKHYIADNSGSGSIYQSSSDFYSDGGDPIISMRTTPHINDKGDYNAIFVDRVWLDMETGVGNSSALDPKVELSWSKDNGHTWSSGYMVSAGKGGEYGRRAIWRRLGRSRNRVWRFVISDPIKKVLLGCGMKARGGMS